MQRRHLLRACIRPDQPGYLFYPALACRPHSCDHLARPEVLVKVKSYRWHRFQAVSFSTSRFALCPKWFSPGHLSTSWVNDSPCLRQTRFAHVYLNDMCDMFFLLAVRDR